MLDAGVTTFVCLMEEFDIDVPEVEWRRGIGSVCSPCARRVPAVFRRCHFLCTAVMPACFGSSLNPKILFGSSVAPL